MSEREKELIREANRRWARNNPEKRAALQRKYYDAAKDRRLEVARANRYRRRYGITVAQYETMLQQQGGCCAICGVSKQRVPRLKHFSVDHDHVTGVVRGLLCSGCNTFLGWLEKWGPKAGAYLGRAKVEAA